MSITSRLSTALADRYRIERPSGRLSHTRRAERRGANHHDAERRHELLRGVEGEGRELISTVPKWYF